MTENQFAKELQILRDAMGVLNSPCEDLSELLADWRVPPEAFAQILMENIELDVFGIDQKVFWLEVLNHMGPDWLEALAKAVAFMRSVDKFN